jgi:hypothetical protein
LLSSQALDPTIKIAYVKEKWQWKFYKAGLQRLKEVVNDLAKF